MPSFTEAERNLLRIVQRDLPDSATPFAELAARTGLNEEAILDLLRKLKKNGSIRRFGANIKHQKAGYAWNAMVAWQASIEEADKTGPLMAEDPMVSHCYFRPSPGDEWPYTLYTMVHGRSRDDVSETIARLKARSGLEIHTVLESLEELKKTSMNYF